MTDEQPEQPEQSGAAEPADTAPEQTEPATAADGPAPTSMPSSWGADEAAAVDRAGRGRQLTILLASVVGLMLAGLLVVVIAKPFDRDSKPQAWPLDVGGRPDGLGQTGELAEAVTPGVEPGAYLWNDFDGWHLWFVFDTRFHAVTGTITSNDDIGKADLTPQATGTASAKGKVLSFDLDTETNIAGIDFEPGFYADRIEIAIQAPDGTLTGEMVHKGKDTTVVALPIVVEMVDAPDQGS